jgi:hypothetical membrane protein
LTGRQYGAIGLAGVSLFVPAVLALHLLNPNLSVTHEYMSVYALGDYGWLMRVGPVLLGLGVVVIALGLRATLASGRRVTAAWALILIAGLGIAAAGLFVTDPTGTTGYTFSGAVHDLAALAVLPGLVVGSWLLRGVMARDPAYRAFASWQLWFAVLLTASTLLVLATPLPGPVELRNESPMPSWWRGCWYSPPISDAAIQRPGPADTPLSEPVVGPRRSRSRSLSRRSAWSAYWPLPLR